ncbi:MAG: NACHT domain-containing protein, partial [Candidatus Aminicenantes bacterium]|nr:NACHT domain-containing protein [Candidatus Aminicenantes bacterium]
ETILFVVSIISVVAAIAMLIITIYIFRKNRRLEEEKFKYQKEQDAKEELGGAVEQFKEKLTQKTAQETYCDHISQKFKYLDFTGLNAILQKPLLLEDIYVKLRAQESVRLPDFRTIADFKELEEEKEEERDDDFVAVFDRMYKKAWRKREPLKMVILGQPGSGKTTLMKWIALQCASTKDIFGNFTPVFIALKDLARDPGHTYRSKNLLELTRDLISGENILPSFIADRFEDNRLLFLLDGLDEAADESVRREVIDWIQKQNLRKNAMLVTSRFSGLQESKGLKFHDAIPVFAVRDFDIADIERFLENWYKNIETAVLGEANEKEIKQAVKTGQTRYEDLMNIINDDRYENLRRLAVNPLLLTIIAIVHRTRAVLPRERHKLYEECLKVMIELWNVANKKLQVSFSVENSLAHLARIAVFLMQKNRREAEPAEIDNLLPERIEDHPRKTFIDEMVLKAGLLYESEGKYGFLHLTFQEYLAAYYFARSENQNGILEYRGKDYWNETFKLFVNIANAHTFFNEIIDNLEEKEYWRNMQLWEDCLQDIVVQQTREEIEIKLAHKILDLLLQIEYKEENEPLILQLVAHYSLYHYAGRFVEEGWRLFYKARHPFVQCVGSSILNRAGDKSQAELMAAIKTRIEEFEKIEHKTEEQLLDFLFQNNNSFVFLISGRQNLLDFNFALAKLKSGDYFINYLDLRYIRHLRYIIFRRDILNIRYILDLRYFIDRSDIEDHRDLLDLLDLLDIQYPRDLTNIRDLREILDLRDLRDIQFIRYIRDIRDLRDLRTLRDWYQNKYESIIKEHKKEIDAWADRASAKLHKMLDVRLLHYFPGTSREDLKYFRDHYPPSIARELKKGDYSIFKELEIDNRLLAETEILVDNVKGAGAFYDILVKICTDKSAELREQRKAIIRYLMEGDKLQLDRPTVLALLNFELDTENIEHQELELRAFFALREKDYARLRELVVGVVEVRPDEATSLNAVFVFKYIN